MRVQPRASLLLKCAVALAALRWGFMPIIADQNERIARNESLTRQLQKTEQRILRGPALEARKQRLLAIKEAASDEFISLDPATLLNEQRLLESTLNSAGLSIESFEWETELPAIGSFKSKVATLSISGKPLEVARGAILLAQNQPTARLVAMQLRNVSRRSETKLSGTLSASILAVDSASESSQ